MGSQPMSTAVHMEPNLEYNLQYAVECGMWMQGYVKDLHI